MGKEARVAGGGSTEREIASQPACWRRAAGLAADVAGSLPARGERVAVAGCGTSWFMAQSYAAARESSGHGETDAFAASEMPLGRRYDRVLVLSRSGTTTEILELLARLNAAVPTVAITAGSGTPVAEAADAHIDLGFADEESVVQTRFATTELVLLRAHLGQDIGPAAAGAERVLAEPLPAEMMTARQFTFLGTGWTYGLAQEAALKLREVDGGLPGHGIPARARGGDQRGQRGVDVWCPAGRAGRRGRRGRRPGLVQRRGPAGRTGPRAVAGRGGGAGSRTGPGPAAEPGPLGHPHPPLRPERDSNPD
jgi:D-arabinose 5-phosphate isomerase GutQ